VMKRIKLADRRNCGLDAPHKLTCVSISRFFFVVSLCVCHCAMRCARVSTGSSKCAFRFLF
jgi:hypothetical protein